MRPNDSVGSAGWLFRLYVSFSVLVAWLNRSDSYSYFSTWLGYVVYEALLIYAAFSVLVFHGG